MLNSQVSGVAIQLRLRYSQSLKPCELQKLIPNHQSSFCWICLPRLTLSIIRSSCPPSHSLGFHFTGINPISLVGLSRWPGEGRYPKHINWSLGFPRARSLDPSSSPHTLHHWVPSYRHLSTYLLPFLRWWHTALSLISTRWSNGSCTDLRLLGRHLGMDERTSPAQPAKTELLVFPANPTLQHDFTIQLGSSTITPSASVRNLCVIFDDQLTFKEHIAKTARSCRFSLHNIRKIRPFLTEHAAQILVQALVISRLDYCNALLAGLPSNTIKPLRMIQNAAARLVFDEPKRAHVTPLFVSLHWLPVAARIQFKTLMLAYKTTTGSAPTYFHSLLRIYIPSRSLRSASERRLVVPSQRGSKSLSRTFSFTTSWLVEWSPTPSGMLDPCQFQATTENSSLSTLLDFIIIKKQTKKTSITRSSSSSSSLYLHLSLYLSLLPLLSCIYLNIPKLGVSTSLFASRD